MRKLFTVVSLVVLVLASLAVAHAFTGPTSPRLKEVQVWYQPTGQFAPVLVKHWVGGRLRVNRTLDYYGNEGSFRLIARLSPARRARVNFLFQDALGRRAGLPSHLQTAPRGSRDVVFTLPNDFAGGPLTLFVMDGTRAPGLRLELGTYVYCAPTSKW